MPRSTQPSRKNPRKLDHDIEQFLAEDEPDRLFIGTFPTGISYADRRREKHGDYLPLARLPFRTLELEWSGATMPDHLRAEIEAHARKIQARRGELYQVSQAGQTVRLGG